MSARARRSASTSCCGRCNASARTVPAAGHRRERARLAEHVFQCPARLTSWMPRDPYPFRRRHRRRTGGAAGETPLLLPASGRWSMRSYRDVRKGSPGRTSRAFSIRIEFRCREIQRRPAENREIGRLQNPPLKGPRIRLLPPDVFRSLRVRRHARTRHVFARSGHHVLQGL